jgi:lysophospholipase L1-like esterase
MIMGAIERPNPYFVAKTGRLKKSRHSNDILKDLTNRHGSVCLDYYTAMNDDQGHLRSESSDDGIHPDHRGTPSWHHWLNGP